MANPTNKDTSRKVKKPPKPYPDFPLTPHNSGKWMKKIRNPITGKSKIHYFGRWGRVVRGVVQRIPGDGWQDALALYKSQADDLHAGRTPRNDDPDGLTLRELCNKFLSEKLRKRDSGELTERSFLDYKQTTDRLIAVFGRDLSVDGMNADDFGRLRARMAAKWGPTRLSNEITRVRVVFNFAYENDLIDRPVRYGTQFEKPSKAILRKHKAKTGKRSLTDKEIRLLINKADPVMKAILLLGINAALGNSDCSELQKHHITKTGWLDFPRPKTGIERRCPLWPETVEAIEAAIPLRPSTTVEENADNVFLTPRGKRLVSVGKSKVDRIAVEFLNLAKTAEVHRRGMGFYWLRHTFQSVADIARDPIATKFLMGHADATMSGHYREFVADENLLAVSNHVRAWLFPDEEGGAV